jgi:hypothetical protein
MDALTSKYCPAQGGERNHQFGQITQRGVEQPTHGVAGLRRHRLRGMAQQRGQRHDGQDGQHEEQRVRFRLKLRPGKQHGHECQ